MSTKIIRSEDDECLALVEYLNILKLKKKVISYTHVPNETYTPHWSQRTKNKALGLASGFPDYIVLGQKKILFIEMKREKGGKTSVEQKLWIQDLDRYSDTSATVCNGFREAKEYLDDQLA